MAERLAVVRALIGALTTTEIAAQRKEEEEDKAEKRLRSELDRLDWQIGRSRGGLAGVLGSPTEAAIGLELDAAHFKAGATARYAEALKLPIGTVITSLEGARGDRDSAAGELRQKEALLSDVSTRIEEKTKALVMLRSELPESRARWIAENNPVCPICAVPIDKAVAEGCGISTATCDLHALQHQIANLKGNVDREAREIHALEGQRSDLQYDLEIARQRLKPLEQTVAAFERSLLDQSSTVRAAQRVADDADRYEKLLIDRANLVSSLERAAAQLDSRRDELSAHRQSARESIARLSLAFDAVLKELVPSNIEGEARLDGNGLSLTAKLDGERSTAAIDSLKVVAFDLAALVMTMEGHCRLPGFLLHDSPREADLGRSIYDRLFEFGKKLEGFGPAPLFQYIVTTTTEPPGEFHSEPWLCLKLRGAPAAERLLKIDL
jgi:DNA repair exonuclease SbcCD ATPase subunit